MNLFWFTFGIVSVLIWLSAVALYYLEPDVFDKIKFRIYWLIKGRTFQKQRHEFIQRIKDDGYEKGYIENMGKMLDKIAEDNLWETLSRKEMAQYIYDWVYYDDEQK